MSGGAATADAPWWLVDDGVRLRVRLVPKSSRDAVDGIEPTADGPAIKARVRAVPEDGKANAAVAALIAAWVEIPKGCVMVIAGQKSRTKTLHIEERSSAPPSEIARRIVALIEALDMAGGGKRGAKSNAG